MQRTTPLFVYLMTADGTPRIGISANPLRRVMSHNRSPGVPAGSKSTRPGAPNWRLDMVVGPFYRGARQFHAQWREHSRKLRSRLVFGCLQALIYADKGLRLWMRNPGQGVEICEEVLKTRQRRSQPLLQPYALIDVMASPHASMSATRMEAQGLDVGDRLTHL